MRAAPPLIIELATSGTTWGCGDVVISSQAQVSRVRSVVPRRAVTVLALHAFKVGRGRLVLEPRGRAVAHGMAGQTGAIGALADRLERVEGPRVARLGPTVVLARMTLNAGLRPGKRRRTAFHAEKSDSLVGRQCERLVGRRAADQIPNGVRQVQGALQLIGTGKAVPGEGDRLIGQLGGSDVRTGRQSPLHAADDLIIVGSLPLGDERQACHGSGDDGHPDREATPPGPGTLVKRGSFHFIIPEVQRFRFS